MDHSPLELDSLSDGSIGGLADGSGAMLSRSSSFFFDWSATTLPPCSIIEVIPGRGVVGQLCTKSADVVCMSSKVAIYKFQRSLAIH